MSLVKMKTTNRQLTSSGERLVWTTAVVYCQRHSKFQLIIDFVTKIDNRKLKLRQYVSFALIEANHDFPGSFRLRPGQKQWWATNSIPADDPPLQLAKHS